MKKYVKAKVGCGFIITKSLDKYEQGCLNTSVIIAVMLLTRPPIHKNCDKQIFMKNPKNVMAFLAWGVWLPCHTKIF